jgi:excinuclease ABC subunit A
MGLSWSDSLEALTPSQRQSIVGDGGQGGLVAFLEQMRTELGTEADWLKDFRDHTACPDCQGSRLRKEANAIKLAGKSISEIVAMPIQTCHAWLQKLEFSEVHAAVAKPILAEMLHRIRFLEQVGVGYLSLDRSADTLSGGEMQRVRLATCIGTGLVGVCYILDEPSIGLHQRDNDRLLQTLRDLQQLGNTVLVVEHDESAMRQADWLIDVGPGAGKLGGNIVAEGKPADVIAKSETLTAQYLRGERSIAIPERRRKPQSTRWLKLRGASANNLKLVDLSIPLGLLTGISGVSGSGKSTLINDTLAPAMKRHLGLTSPRPGSYTSLDGHEQIARMIVIDQSSIGRSPRSTPATYCGIWDEIREVFASTRDAKQRGYRANRFSFNAGPGRCQTCQGQGQLRLEMNFLSDMFVSCNQCNGQRFDRQTLQVRFKNKNIADVLAMSVAEAAEYFENFERIHRTLDCMRRVGLGYLPLGQSSATLSGGECQRLKLATELANPTNGSTLYLLDEPTTGLHFEDVRMLLEVLDGLVEKGNSVVVIEHNLDVLKCCDWLIDMGPEGGNGGGEIVAQGSPEEVAQVVGSHTGRYLREMLAG